MEDQITYVVLNPITQSKERLGEEQFYSNCWNIVIFMGLLQYDTVSEFITWA